MIELLHACVQFKKFQESKTEKGNFYNGVATSSQGNFAQSFSRKVFSIFVHTVFQAPLSWSLWSGYHWKKIFLVQKLSIDNANFGQRWLRQEWNKGQRLPRPVTGGMRVNGLKTCFKTLQQSEPKLIENDIFCDKFLFWIFQSTGLGQLEYFHRLLELSP